MVVSWRGPGFLWSLCKLGTTIRAKAAHIFDHASLNIVDVRDELATQPERVTLAGHLLLRGPLTRGVFHH